MGVLYQSNIFGFLKKFAYDKATVKTVAEEGEIK